MARCALSWSTVMLIICNVILTAQSANIKLNVVESRFSRPPNDTRISAAYKQEVLDYRLPKALSPTNYDLYLHPHIEDGTFEGREVIDILVLERTTQIILHAHKLTINNVDVTQADGSPLEVVDFYLELTREFLVINMKTELTEQLVIKLHITFEGNMWDKIVGLYSSTYLTAEQERRYIATSKFEPTYARQAFPCFDEPAMKATFEVTLVHPTAGDYHALSNMNEQSSQDQGVYTEVHFAKSVPMSTYLACFIVSDFAHTAKPVQARGIGADFEIRMFATAHQIAKVDFALETAVAVTEHYIQYFQVEYPLPKLDMAAIPDFASNAMEHWGLLTYRETALLYDKSYSSTWNKQRTAAVVAHELAHMWFGNLVTMMWWNDLWLNEGFARYMEYKGVNEVYPDWGMPDQFLVHALHGVMKYDATVASHPIIQRVENPDQITEIFDTISYEKGASIIRMLEDVIGAPKFEQAVTNYLNEFKYQNAVTDDFITEVAKLDLDFDVKLFMRTWTEQMGFPVVEVSRPTATTYRLTQKRFFSNIGDYDLVFDDTEFNYAWSIPLTYFTDADNAVQRLWFPYDNSELNIEVPAANKWLKFNAHQVGYYRVNYAVNIWQDLITDLVEEPTRFDTADRAHLLNDVFAMADSSQLSYDFALDATTYLEKETEFVPWHVATAKLQALQTSLSQTDTYVSYLKYARNLLKPMYEELSWTVDENEHLKNRLRVSILTAACSLGLPDCLEQAAAKFTSWLTNPTNKPAPDVREIVYYYGMQHVGQQRHWERMWQLFVAEQDATEKLKLMYGLSAVREPWLLYRFIELAESEANVRQQDYFTCIQNIAANAVGEPVVWDYVRERWPDLVSRFGLNDRYLGRMISSITERFASTTKLEEMQQFFDKYPEAGAGTVARKQALETVKYNIRWLEENEGQVTAWLERATA